MTRHAIVVFVRAPVIGQVKTRLARELGDEGALAAYLELATQCWNTVQSVRRTTGCRTVVAYTPSEGRDAVSAWLTDADAYVEQQGSDLGARMAEAVAGEFNAGAQRILVIGSDCPEISQRVLADAVASLDEADIVFGPTTDGGYYLIGMSALQPSVFANVPCGSEDMLAVTLERAAQAGLRVALLETLSDVDTADDWRAWRTRTDQGA